MARILFILVLFFVVPLNARLSNNANAQLLAGSTDFLDGEPQAAMLARSLNLRAVKLYGLKSNLSSPTIELQLKKGRASLTNLLSPPRVQAMRQFMSRNLPEVYAHGSRVFYPFGGPDFAYPDALFPNMRELVLVGLEPIGELVDVQARASQLPELSRQLTNVYEVAAWSYFITKNMAQFIPRVGGVVNVLAASIAARGYRIINIAPVSFDSSGALQTLSQKARSNYDAVRILYFKDNLHVVTLTYFRQNLADGPMSQARELLNYLSEFDTAYFKATMYLPHNTKGFSIVNRLVLENAQYIVQGDDGIPFGLLEKSRQFKISLFGLYTKPKYIFGVNYQKDLYLRNLASVCAMPNSPVRTNALNVVGILWGQAASCQGYREYVSADVSWGGYLPFLYGYASTSGPSPAYRAQSSNLIYARRK